MGQSSSSDKQKQQPDKYYFLCPVAQQSVARSDGVDCADPAVPRTTGSSTSSSIDDDYYASTAVTLLLLCVRCHAYILRTYHSFFSEYIRYGRLTHMPACTPHDLCNVCAAAFTTNENRQQVVSNVVEFIYADPLSPGDKKPALTV